MSEDCWEDDNNPIKIDADNLPVVHISEDSEQFEENDVGMEKVVTLHEQNCAARKIQASWRNHQEQNSRRIPSPEANEFTDEQYLCALIIQNFYRNYITEKRLRTKQEDAARLIQHHYRHHLRKSEEEFEADLERAARIAQESYNQLQSENESNTKLTLNDHPKTKDSPTIPSSNEEKRFTEHGRQNDAAIIIQRRYRKHLKSQKEKILLKKRNKAAISIQKQYRRYHAEKNNAAIKIQTKYRSYLENKKVATHDLKIEDVSNVATSTVVTKPIAADDRIKSSDYNEYMPEVAAMTIQKHYKSHYEKRVSAATLIQHQFRSYKKSKTRRNETRAFSVGSEIHLPSQDTASEERKAATLIQRQYRAHLLHLSEKSCGDDLPEDQQELHDVADEKEETTALIQDCDSSPQQSIQSMVLGDKCIQYETTVNGGATVDDETTLNDRASLDNDFTVNGGDTIGDETIVNDRASVYDETIVDDVSSTIDGASVDDGIINWHNNLSTRGPNYVQMRPSPKAAAPKSVLSKEPKFHIKPRGNFDKQWPESKKSQQQKVKESPRKKQVQASLEMKREQRRNEKNKRKDKYHLSNLRKRAPNPKFTEAVDKKQENGPKKVKKADTPQLKQKRQSNDHPSEPELLELRESTEEDSSPINVVPGEMEETSSEALEDNTSPLEDNTSLTAAQINNNKNTVLKPGNNINLHRTRSSHPTENSTRHSTEPAHDTRGTRTARRLSDQSSLSSVTQQLSSHNKVSLGTLDSYTVQNMLKRNDLLTRQKNDNHSYLQSYLKQMNLLKRPSPVTSNQQLAIKQRQGWTKKSYSGQLLPGNLEKIAKYGRNSQPENWKSFVDNSLAGAPENKGACRGKYYPVLPAYGKMKSDISEDSCQLNEIPWPTDIG